MAESAGYTINRPLAQQNIPERFYLWLYDARFWRYISFLYEAGAFAQIFMGCMAGIASINNMVGWPNGKALDYESRDCRFDPCVDQFDILSEEIPLLLDLWQAGLKYLKNWFVLDLLLAAHDWLFWYGKEIGICTILKISYNCN
jgi:hypothetical protein